MKRKLTRQFSALLIGHLLVVAAISAHELSEHRLTFEHKQAFNLSSSVPTQLDDWQQQTQPQSQSVVTAGPYSQLLERVYIHPNGYQIMLSIAYGSKQIGDEIQAHRPEYCYRAQGFQITNSYDRNLTIHAQTIPIRDLIATKKNRIESISYLLTISDETVLPGFSRKIAQIKQSMTGNIPDGMVIRVSSLNIPKASVTSIHDAFLTSLLPHLKIGTHQKELL